MKYYIHYGKLYHASQKPLEPCLCYIKKPFYTCGWKILSADGKEFTVLTDRSQSEKCLENQRYLLTDADGKILAEGKPGIAKGTDPWPVSHAPRVDHLSIQLWEADYTLTMLNSQNFVLTDQMENKKMELIHDGVNGGWNITAEESPSPVEVMGLFLFCRCLDKENEFVVI